MQKKVTQSDHCTYRYGPKAVDWKKKPPFIRRRAEETMDAAWNQLGHTNRFHHAVHRRLCPKKVYKSTGFKPVVTLAKKPAPLQLAA